MLQKLPLIFLAFLFSLCCFSQENGQAGPVLPFEIPSQNLLRYNRYLVHPAFSALGPEHTYVSFFHRNQWADYDDSSEAYLANYSGKINERTGFGLGLFQQRMGVIDNFGILANYAYSIPVADDTNLTFGLNVSYYRSGINRGRAFPSEMEDPALQNLENSSLMAFHPGLNLTFRSFNVGVFAENLVNMNLASYQSYIEDRTGKAISAHLMHTLKMEMLTGVFEDGEMTTMIRGRQGEDSFYPSASLIVNFPKLGWVQAGYDDLYGAAAGIGFNLTNRLSLGYTVEKGLSDVIANLGTTHEFSLSYIFRAPEPGPVYVAARPRKRPVERPATPQQPATKEADQEKNPAITAPSISQLPVGTGITAPPVAALTERKEEEKDTVSTDTKRSIFDRQQLDETRLTAQRRQQIQDSIDRVREEETRQALFAEEEPRDTVPMMDEVAEIPVIQDEPDIEDLLFEAAAKQENIRTQTATLMDVDDGYYIIANVFKNEANLKKHIEELERKGWKAGYFKNPANDLNYVYVKQYDTWEEAINQRRKHARELNNDRVWVFRVKNARTVLARTQDQKPFAELPPDNIAIAETEETTDKDTGEQKKEGLNLPLAGGEIRSSVKNMYIPVDIIESVPVFPGCEKLRNNEERKACLANGIDRVIQRRFRASVATGLGLSGIQGIYVEFRVGADGEVSVIRIRAPHKRLEDEARRVIGHIPKMTPGRQGNTPVDVMYSKAIIIRIE